MIENIKETDEEMRDYKLWLEQNSEIVQEINSLSKEEMVRYVYYKDVIISASQRSISSYDKIICIYEEELKKFHGLLDYVYRLSELSNKDNKPGKINNTFTPLSQFCNSTTAIIDNAEYELYKIIRKLSAKKKDFNKGRKSANEERAANATNKRSILDNAVADYLEKAKKDGLNTGNPAVVAYFKKSYIRTQLKQANDKAYTDSTFKRDVELAAAKWRKQQKQKNAK